MFRLVLSRPFQHLRVPVAQRTVHPLCSPQTRFYAKRRRNDDDQEDTSVRSAKGNTVEKMIPGSQSIFGPEYHQEQQAMEEKFQATVRWFKSQIVQMETRTSGRATPDMLSGVTVSLPDYGNVEMKLQDVATVGVTDLSTLLVTVFEEQNLKFVEKGIYAAQLPGLTPQKVDSRTIRIPIPQPTMEARDKQLAGLAKQLEESRGTIRKNQQILQKKVKALKFPKDTDHAAQEEVQKVGKKYIEEMEKMLEVAKKNMAKR